MASLREDKINFDKLAEGANRAMAAEKLYWMQNDAKFRAVKQKGTYDEFRDIVAAAHLRPLDKKDKLDIKDEKLVTPWNSLVNRNVQNTQLESGKNQTPSVPKSSNQFIRHWRSLSSPPQRLEYLSLFAPEDFGIIFKTDIPFGLLGDFLVLFNNDSDLTNMQRYSLYLNELAKAKRFALNLTFLTKSEKEALNELLSKFELQNLDNRHLKLLYM